MTEPSASIVDVVLSHAAEFADRIAFIWLVDGESQELSVTYRDILTQVSRFSSWVKAEGAPGQRVFIAHPSPLYSFLSYLGCQFAGVVAVLGTPARSRRALTSTKSILADSTPTLGVVDRKSLGDFAAAHPLTRWMAYEDIPEMPADPRPTPGELSHLQYTSGTTRTPRGVIISSANVLWNLKIVHQRIRPATGTTTVSWLPLHHDLGLFFALHCLYNASPGVLFSNFLFYQKPERWLRAMTRYQAWASGGPNFAFAHCTEHIAPASRDGLELSSWGFAYCASEPNRRPTLDRFAAAFAPYGFRPQVLSPCYGLAEFTSGVTLTPPGHGPRFQDLSQQVRGEPSTPQQGISKPPFRIAFPAIASCGQPVGDTCLVVVDSQTRQPLPDGSVGEIWVSGLSMARGYWGRPEESEAVFRNTLADGRGPFLATGDLGALHGGEVYIVGRLRDAIRIRGENYSPEAIEETLGRAHPELAPSGGAAFLVEQEGKDQLVLLQEVKRSARQQLDLEAVFRAVRAAVLAEHEVIPHAIMLLRPGGIVKTSSGKISRQACKNEFLKGTLPCLAQSVLAPGQEGQGNRAAAPRSPTVEEIRDWLIHRLALRLQIDAAVINPKGDLSQLGVDSSVAISLTNELEHHFGVRLNPTLFWEHPSIDEMVRNITHLLEAAGEGQK